CRYRPRGKQMVRGDLAAHRVVAMKAWRLKPACRETLPRKTTPPLPVRKIIISYQSRLPLPVRYGFGDS
ncbi:MAG: hypothetical protein ACK2T3_10155, partial [Candidatus Promineifilaceae bacterium]